jgi:putative oxidoreductase
MQDATDTKLFLPFLRPFYTTVEPLVWPLVRVAAGWNFAVHGLGKVMAGPTAMLPAFADVGFHDATALILFLTFIEFVGGICLMFGLFTRFFAAACALELAYICFGMYWPNGFSWLKRGYEYVLLWGVLCFAIALKGGGKWSLDRLIGREL